MKYFPEKTLKKYIIDENLIKIMVNKNVEKIICLVRILDLWNCYIDFERLYIITLEEISISTDYIISVS
jgi:hypothetical protein